MPNFDDDILPRRDVLRARTRGSLVQRLVMVGSGLLGIVLTVLLTVIHHDREDFLGSTKDRVVRLATQEAGVLRRELDVVVRLNAALADRIADGEAVEGLSVAVTIGQAQLDLPWLRGVVIVDAEGALRHAPSRSGVDRDAAVQAARGPWPDGAASQLRRSPRQGVDASRSAQATGCANPSIVSLLRAVTLPTGERRLIVSQIDLDALLAARRGDASGDDSLLVLAQDDGEVIASADCAAWPAERLGRLRRGSTAAQAGGSTGEGLRPGAQVLGYRLVEAYPLTLLVEVDREAALASWWNETRYTFLLAAACALLVYALAIKWLLRSMRSSDAAHQRLDDAEAAVLAQAADLSMTIQSLQELVFRTNADGVIVYVNHDWRGVSGTELMYAEGRRLWELCSPGARGRVEALFATQGTIGPRRAQAAVVDTGGHLRTFDISVLPLVREGRIVGFTGSAVDATEQVEARRELQSQLAFNELLMDTSPLPTAVLDLQGRYTGVNRAWEEFHGFHRGRLIGRSFGSQHLSVAAKALHRRQDERLIDGRASSVRYEAPAVRGDGALRDVVFEKALIVGDRGQPAGVLAVMVDVTDYRRAELTTREARDAAEEASRAKSEFIANISHELRTPLQSIIGFSELGAARAQPGDRLAAMFGEVRDAGHRMLALVNDLLDVSKIESTVGTMHLEVTDLRSVVRDVARELDPLLMAKALRLDFDLPRRPLAARIDPSRFRQALRNILANAIKFSPRHGRIDVQADLSADDEPQVCVNDQGPGIPPGEFESIFEAFVQSTATKDGAGGTGLGLTICRKIIEAHGGRVEAGNAPGGGASFRITLPVREDRSTVAAVLD